MALHHYHRIPIRNLSALLPRHENPLCCICDKPVPLESSKGDEYGRAIHEECYLLKLRLQKATGKLKSPATKRNAHRY
jgi:hypothetical protein